MSTFHILAEKEQQNIFQIEVRDEFEKPIHPNVEFI